MFRLRPRTIRPKSEPISALDIRAFPVACFRDRSFYLCPAPCYGAPFIYSFFYPPSLPRSSVRSHSIFPSGAVLGFQASRLCLTTAHVARTEQYRENSGICGAQPWDVVFLLPTQAYPERENPYLLKSAERESERSQNVLQSRLLPA